ncbi:phosphate acetyltransferase PlsX, partial [Lactobacillus paracasei]|nr:phosphate acetyltransferase PlsX [Lacticaseibacillus paracasei]
AHGAADAETVYYTLLQTAKMVQNGTVTKVADYFDAHPEVAEAKTAEKA